MAGGEKINMTDTSPVKLVYYATTVDNPVLIILTIKIFCLYLLFEIYYQQILSNKDISIIYLFINNFLGR